MGQNNNGERCTQGTSRKSRRDMRNDDEERKTNKPTEGKERNKKLECFALVAR